MGVGRVTFGMIACYLVRSTVGTIEVEKARGKAERGAKRFS